MKKIFIYYSLSGNGDTIANYLSDKNIDIRKVIPKKTLPNNMVFRILTGGFLAGIGYKDELINFDNDIGKYDEVIIGSPICNRRLSSPIKMVLDKLNLDNKKVTFILYSGSGMAPKVDRMLGKDYSQAKIIHIKEPTKNIKNLDKLLNDI